MKRSDIPVSNDSPSPFLRSGAMRHAVSATEPKIDVAARNCASDLRIHWFFGQNVIRSSGMLLKLLKKLGLLLLYRSGLKTCYKHLFNRCPVVHKAANAISLLKPHQLVNKTMLLKKRTEFMYPASPDMCSTPSMQTPACLAAQTVTDRYCCCHWPESYMKRHR